jgi:hypothetical protein
MMSTRTLTALPLAGLLVVVACGGSETIPTTPTPATTPTTPTNPVPPPTTPVGPQQPTVPSTFGGRCVEVQGTVTVAASNVTFQVWDDATIDGDVISLIVNGNTVLNQVTLDGPGNKLSASVPLSSSGYNYVILYAHNEGSLPPNTAALSLNDGRTTQNLVMSANLSTNGAYNIVVGRAPCRRIRRRHLRQVQRSACGGRSLTRAQTVSDCRRASSTRQTTWYGPLIHQRCS